MGSVVTSVGGDNMIRTQIRLDKKEYAMAKREAKALGISVAELVRRALQETLPSSEAAPCVSRGMRYAGFV
jgi:hypothetical protein